MHDLGLQDVSWNVPVWYADWSRAAEEGRDPSLVWVAFLRQEGVRRVAVHSDSTWHPTAPWHPWGKYWLNLTAPWHESWSKDLAWHRTARNLISGSRPCPCGLWLACHKD